MIKNMKNGLTKADIELLNDYFNAFRNFYGKIALRTAFEIINEQNDNKYDESVLLDFSKIKKREKHYYKILSPSEFYDDVDDPDPLSEEIVDESLCEVDDDYYYELDEIQQGKPFYIPPKEELLKYADDSYIEETAEFLALKNFLESKAKIIQPKNSNERNTAYDAVSDYVNFLRYDVDSGELEIEWLLRLVEMPENEEDFDDFLEKITTYATKLHNNTRMWANRGFTPKELCFLMSNK